MTYSVKWGRQKLWRSHSARNSACLRLSSKGRHYLWIICLCYLSVLHSVYLNYLSAYAFREHVEVHVVLEECFLCKERIYYTCLLRTDRLWLFCVTAMDLTSAGMEAVTLHPSLVDQEIQGWFGSFCWSFLVFLKVVWRLGHFLCWDWTFWAACWTVCLVFC